MLNGTQFMSAYGVYVLLMAQHLSVAADTISAISIDAFEGKLDPFRENLHQLRPHPGQIETAKAILKNLEDSAIAKKEKKHVWL